MTRAHTLAEFWRIRGLKSLTSLNFSSQYSQDLRHRVSARTLIERVPFFTSHKFGLPLCILASLDAGRIIGPNDWLNKGRVLHHPAKYNRFGGGVLGGG